MTLYSFSGNSSLSPSSFFYSINRISFSSQGRECGGPSLRCGSRKPVAHWPAWCLRAENDPSKGRASLLEGPQFLFFQQLFNPCSETAAHCLQCSPEQQPSQPKTAFKQANCGFAFWVVYHHIFDVIFSLGEIIFLKQISWLPAWLWDIAV